MSAHKLLVADELDGWQARCSCGFETDLADDLSELEADLYAEKHRLLSDIDYLDTTLTAALRAERTRSGKLREALNLALAACEVACSSGRLEPCVEEHDAPCARQVLDVAVARARELAVEAGL